MRKGIQKLEHIHTLDYEPEGGVTKASTLDTRKTMIHGVAKKLEHQCGVCEGSMKPLVYKEPERARSGH